MNRRELIAEMSDRLGQDKRQVEDFVAQFCQVVTEQVSKGQKVALPGFAKFARVDRKARMGRNPATGEQIKIKASRKARITPLLGLKEAALSGKAPKAPAMKYVPKEAAASKPAAKKTAKKATATKRTTTAKKTAARKPVARKTTAKKSTTTRTASKRHSTARRTTATKATKSRAKARR